MGSGQQQQQQQRRHDAPAQSRNAPYQKSIDRGRGGSMGNESLAILGHLQETILAPATLGEIKKNLPLGVAKHLTPERHARLALSTVGRNAALQRCNPVSIVKCIVEAAEYGLELTPGPVAHAYLVPRGPECTLVISWPGLVALARRGGEVIDVSAACIYRQDKLRYVDGLDAAFAHEPALDAPMEDADIIGAYCITHYRDGHRAVQVMRRRDIDKRRDSSPSGANPKGAWATWYPEMAIKCVIKYAAKKWPKTPEMEKILLKEDEDEGYLGRDLYDAPRLVVVTDDAEKAEHKCPATGEPLTKEYFLRAFACADLDQLKHAGALFKRTVIDKLSDADRNEVLNYGKARRIELEADAKTQPEVSQIERMKAERKAAAVSSGGDDSMGDEAAPHDADGMGYEESPMSEEIPY